MEENKFRTRRPFSLIKKVDILKWIHGAAKNKIPAKGSTHFHKCILDGPGTHPVSYPVSTRVKPG
jgi:hypothetical protein